MAQIIISYRLTENSDYNALETVLKEDLKFQRVGTTSLWMRDGEGANLDDLRTRLEEYVKSANDEQLIIFKVEILDKREISHEETVMKVAMQWIIRRSRDQPDLA